MNHHIVHPLRSRRAMRARPHAMLASGFTLVEVLVVLAIVAGLIGAGAYMVGMITAGDLKDSALSLSASMRYTYNQAAINNTQYRLVFDLDQNTYHAEIVRQARITQSTTRPGDEDALTEDALKLERERDAKRKKSLFDDNDDPFALNRRITTERVQDGLIKTNALKSGVRLDRVILPGGQEISSGMAVINFYPSGYQDPAIIILTDSRDAMFSLETEAMTGRIRILSDEIRPGPNFGEGESDD